ncbi:MAG: alkylmercury lyase [Planctomycetes bacterium]|nr:alkylmercury lyase [Planctomycetota bacterium]
MNDFSVSEIAKKMRIADLLPRFDADESRLAIKLLHLVAIGHPVSRHLAEQTATRLRVHPDGAALLVDRTCEFDTDGNIVGILGLSQRPHPHHFQVNGRKLSTWCAWDALFLPALLGQTAEVESTCPATKASIHARITPDKVENIQPSAAVVSMVLPNQIGKTRDSAEIRNTFCCHVHFFVSQESAAEWIAVKNHDMKLLSVEDGFELGRLAFEHVLDHG